MARILEISPSLGTQEHLLMGPEETIRERKSRVVSAQETKGIPAAHAAIVCPRKSQERERRRRRETADKAAEERQFETGLPHTFCLRDLNLVLIIIKISLRSRQKW